MEFSREEISLIRNMASTYWTENNRKHLTNADEWKTTIKLIKKITNAALIEPFYMAAESQCDTKCKKNVFAVRGKKD
ncbi:hypothetical protein [Polaribacter glomeratus]|uniref:Uncharacterized protein n=1 Tax=Polaribacter glomeratus TaxID=102 RepID=A0A2S7WXD3_9FLAO|nr:hypothetical protein [Polaribacter glomeratus]PQJ81932.1 hypothetical protein BTO16_04805 [Polaribacter glomeratus]TXD64421.1 hypothetical protein ESX12_14975 [Polaribacter glomeratus]